ncbi:hypothetical protein [Dactylosporangium sp. NPDC050588]|uniref:hypothetical protein n=1 Tax=Dactylosporangium sp. NPDC050588 TaxID=3157211 RepID=UPI0033C26BA5
MTSNAEADLQALLRVLSELAAWSNNHLDNEWADRQYIAEHLSQSLAALVKGDPLPRNPF